MAQIWRLLSGNIGHAGSNGESHKAPYDFIPTAAELAANKWRMRFVREVEDSTEISDESDRKITVAISAIPVSTPADTQKDVFLPDNDIRQVSVRVATEFLNTVTDEKILDKVLAQEITNTPKSRAMVIKAIGTRRDYLAFQRSKLPAPVISAQSAHDFIAQVLRNSEKETTNLEDDSTALSQV